ncbi:MULTISPECIES: hypothetical protein [Afifella]|uniref:hypothetical protein n=1 Tax=Afifella TaxID=643217 RepID=UPI000FE333B8|nr:hypothetical protein [Afifella aestuarii]
MTAFSYIDTSDVLEMGRALQNLPGEIRAKAMSRAMRRLNSMAKTRVVRRDAERINIAQKHVRERTRLSASFNAGGHTQDLILKSGWIPLEKLGARQSKRGVIVVKRGLYRHAFRAGMDSGHRGVFRRVPGTRMRKKNKEQIREQFGPNPVNDILTSPEEYLDVLEAIVKEMFAPRLLHEVDRLLAQVGH